MDDLEFKSRIAQVMKSPPTPEVLLERTVQRCSMIEKGRMAEEALRSLGAEKPSEYTQLLAADALLGKLMQLRTPPEGVSAERMQQQLLSKEEFRSSVCLPADKLLNALEKGELLRAFAPKEKPAAENSIQKQKKPELSGPRL